MVATRVDASRLTEALETQEMLLREEQARTAAIDEEAEKAKEVWRKLVAEHSESLERQSILTNSIMLYKDLVKSSSKIEAKQNLLSEDIVRSVASKAKPARIGKQHYRMLHSLRAIEPISLEDLISNTGVALRRVKAQMAEDIDNGLVRLNREGYWITQIGLDLLQRFEEYRRSNGIPLPPLEGPSEDDEHDEIDSGHSLEGAT